LSSEENRAKAIDDVYRKLREVRTCRFYVAPQYSCVDATYWYPPSSVVCLSVGLSVTAVSPAKTAEPIDIPFGL